MYEYIVVFELRCKIVAGYIRRAGRIGRKKKEKQRTFLGKSMKSFDSTRFKIIEIIFLLFESFVNLHLKTMRFQKSIIYAELYTYSRNINGKG